MTYLNKTALALCTVALTGSSIISPMGAYASDFLGSVGLGLGAGGNCDTGESSGKGEIRDKDGAITTPAEITMGKTDCKGSRDLIKHIADKSLKNEERLIQSNHTLGMINSIGSIAAPLFGGLFASSQARSQPSAPAPDNAEYLQVIQKQQQQIEELRQMMAQRQSPNASPGYTAAQSNAATPYREQRGYQSQYANSSNSSLRQVNLF
jgi:hypothetical protein